MRAAAETTSVVVVLDVTARLKGGDADRGEPAAAAAVVADDGLLARRLA